MKRWDKPISDALSWQGLMDYLVKIKEEKGGSQQVGIPGDGRLGTIAVYLRRITGIEAGLIFVTSHAVRMSWDIESHIYARLPDWAVTYVNAEDAMTRGTVVTADAAIERLNHCLPMSEAVLSVEAAGNAREDQVGRRR